MTTDYQQLMSALISDHASALPAEVGYVRSHERRYLHDIETIHGLYRQGPILELGAYPFFLTAVLQQLGLSIFGVDLHPARAAQLNTRHRLQIVAADIERQRLPFGDDSFEMVIFNELLEHLRVDPLFALSEAHRVLKPEGRLLLTTPNLYFIKTIVRFLLGRGFNDPVVEFGKLRSIGHMGHIREYSRREVRRFLNASGFRIERHAFKQYVYPKNLFGLAARPLLALLPIFRGYQMVIAAKAGPGAGFAPLEARAPSQSWAH